MKKILIVANWKMNPGTLEEAKKLFGAVGRGVSEIDGAEVVICPPLVYLSQLQTSNYKLQTGAQDCFWENPPAGGGPFTGEVSPQMLKNLGCEYVILGHSERKSNLGETLEMVNKKVKAALMAGLTPVVCIGEQIQKETQEVLKGLTKENKRRLVLVYEPEWAISTSPNAKPDTPEHAQKAIAQIKKTALVDIPVLYGGSTNSKNVRDFIESGAQGALVGSASLDAKEFTELVKNAALR